MTDLYLDPATSDLHISPTGEARLTADTAEDVTQRLTMRLRRLAGEWFLDTSLGVPYRRDILVKNPDLSVVRGVLLSEILADPSVEAVATLTLEHDRSARALSVTFSCTLVTGEVVEDSLLLTPVVDDLGALIELDGGEILVP